MSPGNGGMSTMTRRRGIPASSAIFLPISLRNGEHFAIRAVFTLSWPTWRALLNSS